MIKALRRNDARLSRTRRLAVLASTTALLAGISPGLASAKGFVVPGPASKYATSFAVGHDGLFDSNATMDPTGTAHLAWADPDATSVISCRLPRGVRACASTIHLPLAHSDDNVYGRTIVLLPAVNVVQVVADECCQDDPQLPITTWTSTDGGRTFGPPVSVGSLDGLSDAALDGGQLVLFADEVDGVHEQVTTTDGSAPATSDTVISSDTGGVKETVLRSGALLIGHENALDGENARNTTTLELQSGPNAAPSVVATFPGEDLVTLTTGAGQSYLMTRINDGGATLDPPVRIRHWNGTSFDAPHTLPIPGPGDDTRFSLAVDGAGRLHAVWVGSREFYRLWHSVSTDGGATWTASLLGDAFSATEIYPVLGSDGSGIALELSAGAGPAVVQPILLIPHLSLSVSHRRVALGGRTTFSGHVTPAVPGNVVLIQRLTGAKWTTVGSTREKKSGAFSVVVTPKHLGKGAYRAFVSGVAGHYDIGASGSVSVTVVAPTTR